MTAQEKMTAQLSMFNMEKRCRNKIMIIIISSFGQNSRRLLFRE